MPNSKRPHKDCLATRIRKLFLLSVLLVLCFAPSNSGAEQVFSRSISFCPLDLTYGDLATSIRQIHGFSDTANRNTPEHISNRERLTLTGGSTKLEISADLSAYSGHHDR